MAPRPGGEADKIGNSYELAWVVRHALHCLIGGEASITYEDPDKELQAGAEFTFDLPFVTEVHQTKRAHGSDRSWTVKSLHAENVLKSAAGHTSRGRAFVFISQLSFGKDGELPELASRAQRSENLQSFLADWATGAYRRTFEELVAPQVLGSAQAAYDMLSNTRFETHVHTDMTRVNAMLAAVSLEGATPELCVAALEQVMLENLGTRLHREQIVDRLAEKQIRPLLDATRESITGSVNGVTTKWRRTVQRDLLSPRLPRQETEAVRSQVATGQLTLLVGTAGGGKSVVAEQAAGEWYDNDDVVLAFRLDRSTSFGSTKSLGIDLGLNQSPVTALAVAASGREAFLVIDQLDAVSLASGRFPDAFDVVDDLIAEASTFSNIHLLLVSRQFDVENDHRLQRLSRRDDVSTLTVGLLSTAQVDSAVEEMGLAPATLTGHQRTLLSIPFNLVLLESVADQDHALDFDTSEALLDAFWQRKLDTVKARRTPASVRFHEVIEHIANAASDLQSLSIPADSLDEDDLIQDARVLVSEHVLAESDGRMAFFHEQFFDYAFARVWSSRGESITAFLASGEQELFRRAQVRQILQRLSGRNEARYVKELEALLLDPQVRYHVTDVAIAFLAARADPTLAEARMVVRVADTSPRFEARLWQRLRQPQWALCFLDHGYVDRWLTSGQEQLVERAVTLLSAAAPDDGDRVAALLNQHRDEAGYQRRLEWLTRYIDLGASEDFRGLVLDGMRAGAYTDPDRVLWYVARDLSEPDPAAALEILSVYLRERPDSFALDRFGRLATLTGRNQGSATQLVTAVARREPRAFAETIVPYLLKVMEVTAFGGTVGKRVHDQHFSHWSSTTAEEPVGERDMDDVLFGATISSLQALGGRSFSTVEPLLTALATSRFEGAHAIVHRAVAGMGDATAAEWGAQLLLAGPGALTEGATSSADWSARELLRAVAPRVSDSTHRRLEDVFRDFTNPYEHGDRYGKTAFTFLSALDERRLTTLGQARLQEYRRKFNDAGPKPPSGLTEDLFTSPISPTAAQRMNDGHWLGAIRRYDSDRDESWPSQGGAYQVSLELQAATKRDPLRFAKFALRLERDMHPAYCRGILAGFVELDKHHVPAEAIFSAIRHIADLGHAENDRYIGWAVQQMPAPVPDDIVERLIDRALHADDPSADAPLTQENDRSKAHRLATAGMNCGRGAVTQSLARIVLADASGHCAQLLQPYLSELASDPRLAVRVMVGGLLSVCLRDVRPTAVAAFQQLTQTEDILLATDDVLSVMTYIGNVETEVVIPLISRMLRSGEGEVRRAGGYLAGLADMWWKRPDLADNALGLDEDTRCGLAEAFARRVSTAQDAARSRTVLGKLMNDSSARVRKAAAEVASHLRGKDLQYHAGLLDDLISSQAFPDAVPQVFITLQEVTTQVSNLTLSACRRFMEVQGHEVGDLSTGAAGDAHYVSELIIRGLAQATEEVERAQLLDILDQLLLRSAYGIEDAMGQLERT